MGRRTYSRNRLAVLLKSAPSADQTAVTEHITSWFRSYATAFSQLASDRRRDNEVLLDFYALPCRLVGLETDMIIRSPEALAGFGGVGGDVERLRQCGLVEAEIADLLVDLINDRSARLEVLWKRTFLNGDAYGVTEVYAVVLTDLGWRIAMVFERHL